jgi:putative holliday junction resolvase
VNENSKRALGIDFGTKRIGYAISDDMGWSARPLEVYARKNIDSDLAYLRNIVESNEVMRIVIGVPYRLNGDAGPEAERAQLFVEAVRTAIPKIDISTIDEALTTFEANNLMDHHGIKKPQKRKELRDAYAAAVILQEDLDLKSKDSVAEN